MRNPARPPFAQVVRETAPLAAFALFRKARRANSVAKIALDRRSRTIAYGVKDACIEAARRLAPRLFRQFPDPDRRRWVVRLRGGTAMHGRRMDGAP